MSTMEPTNSVTPWISEKLSHFCLGRVYHLRTKMRFEAACEAYVETPNRDWENLLVKKSLEDIIIVDGDAELLVPLQLVSPNMNKCYFTPLEESL